jgi:hypothetical protein
MYLNNKNRVNKSGSVLVFAVIAIAILTIIGVGLLAISYGVRIQASRMKSEETAMLVAEAGYESAVYWIEQQSDMTSYLKTHGTYSNSLSFDNSTCDYTVSMYAFYGSRPAYQVLSKGYCGRFSMTADVIVMQAISGWDMGLCRIPSGAHSTSPVYFGTDEVIDFPVHINKANDSPDARDIFISGTPDFRQDVSMGESRYTSGGSDKYSGVMSLFDEGISFNQPNSRINDEDAVNLKIGRFADSTNSNFKYTPAAKSLGSSSRYPQPTVQLEFYVTGGVGKVRITNNVTTRGYEETSDSRTFDFKVTPGSDDTSFQRYPIYAYHYIPSDADATGQRKTWNIEDTYVTQTIGSVTSEPGGQIYINGNVVIGGDLTSQSNAQVVKGKITVVATGNIWIADSVTVDGAHDADGLPSANNTNAFGLIAGGVVKVVDPGMTNYTYVESSGHPYSPPPSSQLTYVPVGVPDDAGQPSSDRRHLADPTVIEASVTVGGGGWGAENVKLYRAGRKVLSAPQDDLVVRGTISEVVRGVVGHLGADGYRKKYYFDERFLEGILPGDMWLRGKFIPAPAGWKDYRTPDGD